MLFPKLAKTLTERGHFASFLRFSST
jgi:hypothetical protein